MVRARQSHAVAVRFLLCHPQAPDDITAHLLLSAEPGCGTSFASGSAVKLGVGGSARLEALA